MDHKKTWMDFIARYRGDSEFAKTVDRDPAAALKDAGLPVPEGVNIQLVKEEANKRYLVIPHIPLDATEDDLKKIAGGDCSSGAHSSSWSCSGGNSGGGSANPCGSYCVN